MYPIINYNGFGCNNMVKLFNYQILASRSRFVLKLKWCKNLSAIFPIDVLLMVMKSYDFARPATCSASPSEYDLCYCSLLSTFRVPHTQRYKTFSFNCYPNIIPSVTPNSSSSFNISIFNHFSRFLHSNTSISHEIVLQIIRYIELIHSLWHRAYFTKKVVYVSISIVWILAFLIVSTYQLPTTKVKIISSK